VHELPANCFLTDLLSTGRIRAAASGQAAADAIAELPAALLAADELARLEWPGTPPALAMPAAVWAAALFYHACRFLVYRDLPAEAVRGTLMAPCPLPPNPSVCYSVDLSFRYLPDLLMLARGIALDDPLVEELMILARQWPLSSVGIAMPAGVDSTPFIGDRCLLSLYVERIILREDIARLDHPIVRDAARHALGLHSKLCPRIARTIWILQTG